jgi:hypothetical protein
MFLEQRRLNDIHVSRIAAKNGSGVLDFRTDKSISWKSMRQIPFWNWLP